MSQWSPKRTVLGACTMAFFATMVARLVISPVVPAISAEFGVSNAVIGLALSGMWLAYALAQFPSGLIGDRVGERLVILVAVGGTAVASLLLAFSPVFIVFFVLTAVLGGAAGLHYSVATTLLSRTFEKTGTAIGIHSAGAPIAGVFAPVVAAYIGTVVGWRYAVVLGAVAGLPAAVIVAYGIPSTTPAYPETPIQRRVNSETFVEILSRPPIAGAMVVSVLSAFVWQGTASFLPTFLIEHRDYSETTAGFVFSGYFLIQGVGQPGIGWLSDRIGRDTAMGVCMGCGVVGYASFVVGPGLVSVAAGTVLVGVAMSWGSAILPKVLDHMTEREEGLGFGLVRTTYMILGASGSAGTGLLADYFDWGTAFLVLAGIQGVVLLGLGTAVIRRQLRA